MEKSKEAITMLVVGLLIAIYFGGSFYVIVFILSKIGGIVMYESDADVAIVIGLLFYIPFFIALVLDLKNMKKQEKVEEKQVEKHDADSLR